MKIILHSLDDLNDLLNLFANRSPVHAVTIRNNTIRPFVPATDPTLPEYHDEAVQAIRNHLEAVNEAGPGVTEPLPEPDHVIDAPVDADGVPHNTNWHSGPPKLNAGTGLWKARRKRDEDAYQAWLAKCREDDAAAADAAASAEADEPLATETHALPEGVTVRAEHAEEVEQAEEQQALDTQDEPTGPNLAALIAASQEAAEKAPSDQVGLLDASKLFISAYSTAAFHALKSAVAPIEGTSSGKAMQTLTPEERQLLRACMANYPLYV